jgi:membrane associated rhomboid family serine protease
MGEQPEDKPDGISAGPERQAGSLQCQEHDPGRVGEAGVTARAGGGATSSAAAPVVLTIVVLCAAVFICSAGLPLIPRQYLVFSPGQGLVFPGIITHMFAHASPMHLLGNMVVLYFLGSVIERNYGASKFLTLYFCAGLFAALAEGAVHPDGLLLGASGAIAGVMAAFVRHYPRAVLYLYGLLPIPAWLFMLLWLGFNLWGAAAGGQFNIAFSAHIAGFCAGFALSLLLVRPRGV